MRQSKKANALGATQGPQGGSFSAPGFGDRVVADGKGPAEIWITGKASQMATANLEKFGWKVVPQAGAQLGR